MNLQTVAQTSGNNWGHISYPFQRAYERAEPRPQISQPMKYQGLAFFAAFDRETAEYKASLEVITKELRNRFGMVSDALVATFLLNHRSLPHLLTEAFDRLQEAFETSVVVNLEVSIDEDGYQTLYAIALWREDAHRAAVAFNSFVENWWLHKMSHATSDVVFVYQLI